MTIFSKLLAVGSMSTSAYKTVYTTPLGHTAIIKTISLTSNGPTAMSGEVNVVSPSGARTAFALISLTQFQPREIATWTVLPEGWLLRLLPTLAQAMTYVISGSELIGLPPTATVPTFAFVQGDVPPPFDQL